ncbi:ALQxL family class IV lanthipeptide [Micromonospora sp. B11E3]
MEMDINALQLLEEEQVDEYGRFPCTDASCSAATCDTVASCGFTTGGW